MERPRAGQVGCLLVVLGISGGLALLGLGARLAPEVALYSQLSMFVFVLLGVMLLLLANSNLRTAVGLMMIGTIGLSIGIWGTKGVLDKTISGVALWGPVPIPLIFIAPLLGLGGLAFVIAGIVRGAAEFGKVLSLFRKPSEKS